jgi:hypothetical protein
MPSSLTTVYGSRHCAKQLMRLSIPRKGLSRHVVRLKLYKGNIITAGKKSPFSLYREDFATFGQEDVYDQSHAEGFIRLYGLSMKVRAMNGCLFRVSICRSLIIRNSREISKKVNTETRTQD